MSENELDHNRRPLMPKPTKLSKQGIFEFAESLAKALDYSVEAKNLRAVVGRLGGKLAVKNFWTAGTPSAESMHVSYGSGFTIYLPDHTSETRDNFTIAHEVGHYLLHYVFAGLAKEKRDFVAYRYGHPEVDPRTEWEANWFAAGFLMPRKEFTSVFSTTSGSVDSVAEHFSVTPNAAEIRAKDLQLL